MTFQPQNTLERSLVQAAEDPAHRPQFIKDFTESDIFIVQYSPPPKQCETAALAEGFQFEIQHIEFNGKPYIPVFSSLPRLQAVLQEEAGYIAVNALEFLNIIQGAEILLNPGSDFGRIFTKDEIQSIIDGSIWKPVEPYRIDERTKVLIGQPANYPHELAGALSRLFSKVKEVKRAYVAHIFIPKKDKKPHTLIGIEVEGNWDQVVAQAGLVVRDINIPDPPVDFIQVPGHGGPEDYFLDNCEPFYERR